MKKGSRILVLSPFYPPSVGGLQSHARDWNSQLSKLGHKIITLTADTEHTPSTPEVLYFPSFNLIPGYPTPKFWHPKFWRLLKRALKSKPDIVISRTRFFLTSMIALFIAKIYKIPWIHIEHGSDFVKLKSPLTSRLAKLYDLTLGKLALKQANILVANSKSTASFIKQLSQQDSQVIYRGLDFEKIKSIQPSGQTHQIIYAGRLIDGKGLPDLFHALEPNWNLTIIGSGPQEEALKQLASKLKLGINWLGELSWPDLISHLKSSHIFVNPSYTEGIPTSVIEAAACNCHVIATNVGGTPEIPAITLIPPHSPQKIKQAIQKKLNQPRPEPDLAQLENLFSWQKAAEQYNQILCDLA